MEAEDDNVRKNLGRLMNDEQTEFRSPHDINRLLNDKAQVFSYTKFLTRVEKLLRSWVAKALGVPVLHEVYFPNEENKMQREKDALTRMKQARERLEEDVEDPLPEVAAYAARARRGRRSPSVEESSNDSDDSGEMEVEKQSRKRKGHMLDKKKSATRIAFDGENGDDDDEEIDEPEERDPSNQSVLSSPKRRKSTLREKLSPSPGKTRKSQAKKYDGRRAWSNVETMAIREGIAEYGMGKWAIIKEHFDVVLSNRTSGQIKVSLG